MKELSVALGDTPAEKLIKEGKLSRREVKLRFAQYTNIIQAFAPMVREQAFDVGELSLVTFLQALEAGKPLKLLPVVINGFMHHSSLFYLPDNGFQSPETLPGKSVFVRSYTQTMGMWVRGILSEQYGVSPDTVRWVCNQEAHVKEYTPPANVTITARDGAELLGSGEVSAAIVAAYNVKDPRWSPLIPDPDKAAEKWYRKHQTVMINHVVAVTEAAVRDCPEGVQAVYDLLCEATDITQEERGRKQGLSAVCHGADRIWNGGAIQIGMQYSMEQRLLSRSYSRKEIFLDI